MTDLFLVLFPPQDDRELAPFLHVMPEERLLRTMEDFVGAFRTRTARRYVAFNSVDLMRAAAQLRTRRPHRLLLLERAELIDRAMGARLNALSDLFQTVVRPDPKTCLSSAELVDVLASPKARDLAIAATYDPAAQALYVLRGSLETIVLPERAFSSFGAGPKPDFTALRVEDGGQTLQAGDYEAAFDALLYEHDLDFRRRLKQKRRASEQSLGASVRRLRLQRGLRHSDFVEISAKEIARIECGDVKMPRGETLKLIAKRLEVPVKDLEDY